MGPKTRKFVYITDLHVFDGPLPDDLSTDDVVEVSINDAGEIESRITEIEWEE